MHVVATVAGLSVILIVLSDAFATIVLPRRVNRRFSPSRLVLLVTWRRCGASRSLSRCNLP